MKQHVAWKIGGEAGFGIMAAGTMVARAFARQGYCTIAANDYPSLVRGGHNAITVGIGTDTFHSLHRSVDILIALHKETLSLHAGQLHEGSYVLYDPQDGTPQASDFPVPVELIAIELSDIVASFHAESIMRNTVALGAAVALLGAEFTVLSDVIHSQFEKKGNAVIDENIQVARKGFDVVKKTYGSLDTWFLDRPAHKEPLLVMNASEAVGLGAVDGGMKFAAIYPMTPINALITLFADYKTHMGITYIQPEDEIAGVNMAIGASIAGVRSMVATSGGGYSLMTEGVSLAGIAEVPLVIDLGMRPGPATGMPTYTEQGELLLSIFSGHGEFPRIILAPGDVIQSYQLSRQAFDLSQQYQIPVCILTDKYLNENQWSVSSHIFHNPPTPQDGKRLAKDSKNEGFKRYDLSCDDGISPRSFPGMEHGICITNSYEHNEQGFTTEDASVRIAMVNKRNSKAQAIIAASLKPSVYGQEQADVTFVSFGSTKGPILEALPLLQEKGIQAKLIHFTWVYPLNGPEIKKLLMQEKRLVVVEGNSTGQFAKLLRQETGITIEEVLLKYDGRQWFPEEIVEQINKSDKSTNNQINKLAH